MRTLALAAAIGVGLFAGGPAFAEQWNDPNGRLTFNAPSGWMVRPQPSTGQTVVMAFNPSNDCFVFSAPNPGTANSSANAVRNSTTPLPADGWVQAASRVRDFFPAGSTPALVSQSVDTSGFWPVQRAELSGGPKTVYGAIMARPGVEIRAFCAGADSAGAYDSLFASLGHPNDAAWQQAASEQASQAAAAQAAAPAPAQQEQTQEEQQPAEENNRRERRNRDPSRRD
jgi:hypothetical protein